MKRLAQAAVALGALLGSAALAADDIQFFQSVDRNEVGTEDTFRLTIVVGNAPEGAQPQLGALHDFEVLNNSQSTEMSYHFGGGGPGVIQRVNKHVLILRANRAGKLTIGPSTLSAGGRTYKTEAIELTVKKGHVGDPSARPHRPQPASPLADPFRNFPFPGFPGGEEDGDLFPPDMDIPRSDSDLFVKAAVDKDNVYVGEQVTLALWIFSRVDLSSVDQVTTPKLEGFWSEEVDSPTQLAAEQRILNGIPYRAYLLKRIALFPLRAGSLTIGPTGADISTGFFLGSRKIHRESNELTLKVRPLPPGAPPGFSPNNVGRWRLTSEQTQSQVELGQPVTFRVVLDGKGNLKNVHLPPLVGPPSLKIFDPTTSDKVGQSRSKYGGRRVAEYVVVPQQTGRFELPGLAFTYFDPETGRYEASRTDSLVLNVLPSAGGASAAIASSTGGPATAAAKNVLNAGGLKPLRLAAAFTPIRAPLWRRPFFLPLAAGPFCAWFVLVALGALRGVLFKEDEVALKKRKARAARKRLGQAERLKEKGDPSAFYGEVEKALLGFVDAKLGAPVAGLTRDALAERIRAVGVPEERARKVLQVLEACDVGRFAAGAGDTSRAKVLDAAEEAMESWSAR